MPQLSAFRRDYPPFRLKSTLIGLLQREPDPAALNAFVRESQKIAAAYLKQKIRRRRLDPSFFGLRVDDLAIDCFADLLRRDDMNRFFVIEDYFEALNWKQLDDDQLRTAFRRLIFGQVSEGLFRRYREADPSLSRILRNLKLAARSASEVTLVRRDRHLWLLVGAELSTAPVIPDELAEAYIIHCLHPTMQIPHVLDAFAAFLKRSPQYRNGYPLTGLAQIVRSAFALSRPEPDDPVDLFTTREEGSVVVATVAEDLRHEKRSSYVDCGKVLPTTYHAYFLTICDILEGEFVNGSPQPDSYQSALERHIEPLSNEAYHDEHRNILEYLTKLARKRLIRCLRQDIVTRPHLAGATLAS